MLKGIAASSGITIAKAYKLETTEVVITQKTGCDCAAECAKFDEALAESKKDIETIKEIASARLSEEELAIFDAHLMVADDPALADSVKQQIETEGCNAEYALETVANMYISMFEAIEDEYMRARAADIRDVTTRIKLHILGLPTTDLSLINEDCIIVAEDLTPSDTAQLNTYAKGFATEVGGRTSHSAIMARSLEIPAVVGCKGVMETVKHGDMLILDGLKGEVIVNPDEATIAEYEAKAAEYAEKVQAIKAYKDVPTVTTDGHHVELVANIGSPKDVEGVINNGGEGVGLFRSEFLYMGASDWPTEDEQFEAYKTVLAAMNPKPVVVRTLDIGGDKKLDYYQFDKEMNPFLGYRAIRLCLDQTDIFRTQLRALIRASAYGKLRIMFPMIATINEFKAAKAIYEEEKANLIAEGVEVSDDIQVGMMVEIPAAAVLADQFAKYADFFSIGTNDLIQYSMAADRMSEKVSYLYQPFNPSILNLVAMTIRGAHKEGKWCGMCGEMAGEPDAISVLMGLGLDEFSMSATSICNARRIANNISYADMQVMAEKCLAGQTAEEVLDIIHSTVK